jgi:hypothetical protein
VRAVGVHTAGRAAWPASLAACPPSPASSRPAAIAATDPLLVARRHVDFLRIRSAI